jgi:hypothetical protein
MAIVTEPAGTDVPDGTVVLWTTNLGHVDRETRTERGIARNRLVADSRSGTATVVATSGGEAQVPTPNPSASPGASPSPGTPTTTPTSTTSTTIRTGGSSAGAQRLLGAARNSAVVDVTIGNALVQNVLLRAVPSRITVSNSTQVIATVLDSFGNPVANVPVYFEVLSNTDFEFFDSAGAAVHTDNNGEAQDTLRTRRLTQGTITVRALATGGGAFIPSNTLPIPVL